MNIKHSCLCIYGVALKARKSTSLTCGKGHLLVVAKQLLYSFQRGLPIVSSTIAPPRSMMIVVCFSRLQIIFQCSLSLATKRHQSAFGFDLWVISSDMISSRIQNSGLFNFVSGLKSPNQCSLGIISSFQVIQDYKFRSLRCRTTKPESLLAVFSNAFNGCDISKMCKT